MDPLYRFHNMLELGCFSNVRVLTESSLQCFFGHLFCNPEERFWSIYIDLSPSLSEFVSLYVALNFLITLLIILHSIAYNIVFCPMLVLMVLKHGYLILHFRSLSYPSQSLLVDLEGLFCIAAHPRSRMSSCYVYYIFFLYINKMKKRCRRLSRYTSTR